jgi:hypothetical protein
MTSLTSSETIESLLSRCPAYQDGFHAERREISDDLHDRLVEAHLCPNCASYVIPGLAEMRFCEETAHTHEGHECPDCEEFFITGKSTSEPVPDDGHSDADPGL